MTFLFYTFFAFKLQKLKDSTWRPVFFVSSPFFFFVFSPFLTQIFLGLFGLWSSLWNWGGATASLSLLLLSSPPLPDESRYYCWGLSWWVELCSVDRSDLSGSSWRWGAPLQLSSSQQILVVQQLGVLTRLPEPVEAEVEVHLNHLFALMENENHLLQKQNHFIWDQYIVYIDI